MDRTRNGQAVIQDSVSAVSPVTNDSKILNLDITASKLRDEFIGWQCRLRRQAMRGAGGRPSEGMCPQVLVLDDAAGDVIAGTLTVLLARTDSATTAKSFEFQFKRTHDPLDRYERAVTFLSADYYQHPDNFSGVMTALVGAATLMLLRLLDTRQCILVFHQFNQGYRVPCHAQLLAPEDALFKATYWHNAMFNANLPPDVAVVGFLPDWVHASRKTGPPPAQP
jgi:hypothetical protein